MQKRYSYEAVYGLCYYFCIECLYVIATLRRELNYKLQGKAFTLIFEWMKFYCIQSILL